MELKIMILKTKYYLTSLIIFISLPEIIFGQDWATPEIIYENPNQAYLCLSVVIDNNNTTHLVWSADCDRDQNADSLFYLQKNGHYHLNPVSMSGDSIILTLAAVMGVDQKLHVIWGERSDIQDFPDIQKIYYSRVENMSWLPSMSVAKLDETTEKVLEIKMVSLPDSSLLAYWCKAPQYAIYFSYFKDENWSSRFIPFVDYSSRSQNGPYGSSAYPDIVKDNRGILHITFRGTTGEQKPPEGRFINQINYLANDANNRDWEKVVPLKIFRSTDIGYHHPKIAIADENVRYISWLVDRNLNNQPDGIQYTYSKDGETWTEPKSIIELMEELILNQYIVSDHSGKIHLLWTRYVFGVGPRINYAIIHEDTCIRQELNFFSPRRSPHSVKLLIDHFNREHLYWVEYKDESDTNGIEIKHTWRDLPTKISNENQYHRENKESITCNITSYPNPFNESTTLNIELSKPSRLTVSIYNMKGQLVKTLLSQQYVQAKAQAKWDGVNQNNQVVSSGVYFYLVQIKNEADGSVLRKIGKLILLR